VADPVIRFDVLLRSAGTGRSPTTHNIADFRPADEAIERCRRWLSARGVEVHSATFSLACAAPVALFESLFDVKVVPIPPAPGCAPWCLQGGIRIPAEVATLVEDVTLTPTPEFFGR
jgi:hypothetical protein